jgi:hypothetical protein
MVEIQHLEPGTKIKLKSGALAEVSDNPRDGVWMYVRDVETGAEEMVNADDVVEVAS